MANMDNCRRHYDDCVQDTKRSSLTLTTKDSHIVLPWTCSVRIRDRTSHEKLEHHHFSWKGLVGCSSCHDAPIIPSRRLACESALLSCRASNENLHMGREMRTCLPTAVFHLVEPVLKRSDLPGDHVVVLLRRV